MLGKLALQRTNWAALAVLAALAVALFAVLQPASAQAGASLKVTINDSDNVIAAGHAYQVDLTVVNGTGSYSVEYITVSNGVFVSLEDTAALGSTAAGSGEATLVVPSTASGEYTITAGVKNDASPVGRTSGELVVTVGDVGSPIGSVEVVLGTVYDDDSDGAPNFVIADTSEQNKGIAGPDSATKAKGSVIGVTVKVLNSLGEAPNAGEISEILIFAPSAFVVAASGEVEADAATVAEVANANSAEGAVGSATTFNFWVSDGDEGTIDVYAVAIGSRGGTATSASLPVSFTGDASAIMVSAANSPIAQRDGSGYVTVTAVDKSDNPANLNAAAASDNVTAKLVDGNGDQVPAGKAAVAVRQNSKTGVDFHDGSTRDNDLGTTDVDESDTTTFCDGTNADSECDSKTLRVTVTTTSIGLPGGEYTLEVKLGTSDAVTATIVVAGNAANVDVQGGSDTVAVGDIVSFTATVTDKDGNVIPDGTDVEFNAVGALVLTGLGGGANAGVVTSPLNDGIATARYVVVRGSGTATIIATHGEGAKAIDGVTSVATEAEEPAEPVEPEEVSLGCLNPANVNSFSTYDCGIEATASELFDLVASRGASAIHLWNGSAWVRYSVVEGQTVPGSSDFVVEDGNILYISG